MGMISRSWGKMDTDGGLIIEQVVRWRYVRRQGQEESGDNRLLKLETWDDERAGCADMYGDELGCHKQGGWRHGEGVGHKGRTGKAEQGWVGE